MNNQFQNDFHSYAPGRPSQTPQKSNRTRNIVIILAVVGSMCMLVCCGGLLLVVQMGASVVEAEIETQLRDHPQVRERVGELSSVKHDWAKSLNEDDYDIWIFDIEGSEGKAEVKLKTMTDDDGSEVILSGTLRDERGEVIQLEF